MNWGGMPGLYYGDYTGYWYTLETVTYSTKSDGGVLVYWQQRWIALPNTITAPPLADCYRPDVKQTVIDGAGLDTNTGMWARPEDVGAVLSNGDPLNVPWVWVPKPQ
jgi:hypothetical protein